MVDYHKKYEENGEKLDIAKAEKIIPDMFHKFL